MDDAAAPSNIVLAGLMGSGKSTVARLLAQRLGRDFIDTDDLVEQAAAKPVHQVFADDGEAEFRRLEAAAVQQAAAGRGQVIAVGGGAVCDERSVAALRSSGAVILLDAPPEVLAQRAAASPGTRPLLGDHADAVRRLASLRQERAAAYSAASDHVIDTEAKTPQDVADAVLAWLQDRSGALSEAERAR